jgi:quercetin dioxygenase-like cupin family protein
MKNSHLFKLFCTAIFFMPSVLLHAQSSMTINTETPPGKITRALISDTIIKVDRPNGTEVLVVRTVCQAGTRTPIHRHDHSGVTCVLEGEMTLFLEGSAPQRAQAGDCYNMPAGLHMVGANLGTVDAVMHDIFTVPKGDDVWTVLEAESLQNQFHRH